MNKSDLIEKVVERSNLPRKRAESVVNLMFDSMIQALVKDERIEIRGFGSFVSKHYRARTGRNPRTGTTINVSAKRLPFFKVGKELRERVDYGGAKSTGPESTEAQRPPNAGGEQPPPFG